MHRNSLFGLQAKRAQLVVRIYNHFLVDSLPYSDTREVPI